MKPSKKCYDLIKIHEGCKLTAYVDPGTKKLPITIGWGSTMRTDGTRFQLGDHISQETADNLLEWSVNHKGVIVDSLTSKVHLRQSQFDALVSFTYNVGVGNFESSTLLKLIRINPNDPGIPAQFKRWTKAGGKVMKGLINRREAEAALYVS